MIAVAKSWPGETVVCLASGPSLTQADCDFVRGKARVIAVNDGVRLAPWADVLYSSDRYWWPAHKGYPSFQGLKYGIGSAPPSAAFPRGKRNPFHQYLDVTVLRNTGYDGLELEPDGLRNGKNSGYAAVNLAVHFGASRILLLGYDMGTNGGPTHFFGEHIGMTNPTDSHFHSWRRLFATMVEPLKTAGVEVINCSRSTRLDCFPRATLEQALAPVEVMA